MRGIGVVEDGHAFLEPELARGTPRFWWSAPRKAAFASVLARRSGEAAPGAPAPPGMVAATAVGAVAVAAEVFPGGGGEARYGIDAAAGSDGGGTH